MFNFGLARTEFVCSKLSQRTVYVVLLTLDRYF